MDEAAETTEAPVEEKPVEKPKKAAKPKPSPVADYTTGASTALVDEFTKGN